MVRPAKGTKRDRVIKRPKTRTPKVAASPPSRRIMRLSAPHDTNAFSFLDLPPEIRNMVYELLTPDMKSSIKIRIRPRGRDCLVVSTKHAFSLICHQVRDELEALIKADAPVLARLVVADVNDFNCYNAIKFTKRMVADIDFEPLDFYNHKREMQVAFKLSESFARNPPVERIRQWLNWVTKELPPQMALDYGVRDIANVPESMKVLDHLTSGHSPGVFHYFKDVVTVFKEWEKRNR